MIYEAPRPNFSITNRDAYERTKVACNCAQCGNKIVPFSEPDFIREAGYGYFYIYTPKCGLCETCYKAEKEKPEKHYIPVPYRESDTYSARMGDGKIHDLTIIVPDEFAKVWSF